MPYGVDFRKTYSIHSFEDARRHFDKTALPRKGFEENQRPLGEASKPHLMLIKEHDSYICRLYRTDMVRYYEVDRVDVHLDPRMTSKNFLQQMLPLGLHVGPSDTLSVSGYVGEVGGLHYVTEYNGQSLKFERTNDLMLPWQLIGEHGVRTKKAAAQERTKEVRAKLKPFCEFMQVRHKLCPPYVGPGAHALSKGCFEQIMTNDMDVWIKYAKFFTSRESFLKVAYERLGCFDMMPVPTTTKP